MEVLERRNSGFSKNTTMSLFSLVLAIEAILSRICVVKNLTTDSSEMSLLSNVVNKSSKQLMKKYLSFKRLLPLPLLFKSIPVVRLK